MIICDNGWGDASVVDILAVLDSVVTVFSPCFAEIGLNPNNLHIIHSDGDYPICYREQGIICLTASDRFWCKYSYQFSHEYCHFQIRGEVQPNIRWLEESLCETASYYFLPKVGKLWADTPPYQNWKSYAPAFLEYVKDDTQKATPFNINFSQPNNPFLAQLRSTPCDRSRNAFVALKLLPLFEENPALWNVVPLLVEIPNLCSLYDAMKYWIDVSPVKFKPSLAKIAEVFSLGV